jgi:hypothetical protein
MWEPLNYKINGKNFVEIAQESDRFARLLEREGILTNVMDDAALMAKHCRMDFRDFREHVRHYLTVGDHKSMSAIVYKINESAKVLPTMIPA